MRSRPARSLLLVAIMWRLTCAVDAQQPSIPSLTDTTWTLWKFEERGGSVLEPEDQTKYRLRFGAQLEAQLDCNKLQSTWKATGAELRFGKLEGPRLKCAAGSMADRMVHDWRGIRSYSVRSNLLYLALKNGRGWYVFQSFVPITARPTASVASQHGPIQFDPKGAEFGPWIRRFVARVRRNWFVPAAAMALRGRLVVEFDVHRDGRISDVVVSDPSPVDSFNSPARLAVEASSPADPLPDAYPDDKAHFTVTFYYNEKPPDTPDNEKPPDRPAAVSPQ